MLEQFSLEIQNYIKTKCLNTGDVIHYTDDEQKRCSGKFVRLHEVYYGRLGAPGVEPGKYIDRKNIVVRTTTNDIVVEVGKIELSPEMLQKYATLPADCHLISLAPDKIAELPETSFIEGDVVRLVDEVHPNYNEDINENQFTINRIDYSSEKYKLRRGPLYFYAEKEQLFKCGDGPVRIFYGGEGYKLRWRSVQDEAEFYVLLGRYLRVYNPLDKSYAWDLETAKQMISLGKAHAVVKEAEEHWLITFWDHEIGQQMTYYPEVVLTI